MSEKAGKRAVVTGGAGFIGSHLTEYLLSRGLTVRVVDNFVTGYRANLSHLLTDRLEIISGDVSTPGLMDKVLAKADYVYHLAASVGVRYIMNNLVTSIENNVSGTARVLAVAAKYGIRTLLTSTSEVYGKTVDRPSGENDDLKMGSTLNSRWSYACSKALDEYLAFAYWREKKLPITVARLFNTVGERQSAAFGMVLPTFIQQALKGEPLFVYGDGEQTRCFCHVSDVVRVLCNLMEHPDAAGEVFNVGSTEQISIISLAKRVIELAGSSSPVQFVPYAIAYREGFEDTEKRVPNIAKIQTWLDFTPRFSLDQIIEFSINKVAAAPVRQI